MRVLIVAGVLAGLGAGMAWAQQGDMMAQPRANLRQVSADQRVESIGYCSGTYTVTSESGQTFEFTEFDLRFKTDASAEGPPPGRPAILSAGMMGDRAFVIFAAPEEISAAVEETC